MLRSELAQDFVLDERNESFVCANSPAYQGESKDESNDAVEGLTLSQSKGLPPANPTAQKTWSVYILHCRDGAYYVGLTNDLARRWEEHRTGRGSHYTRCNPPLRLVYHETFPTRIQAEARERQLKGWTRRKKQALIEGDITLLKSL